MFGAVINLPATPRPPRTILKFSHSDPTYLIVFCPIKSFGDRVDAVPSSSSLAENSKGNSPDFHFFSNCLPSIVESDESSMVISTGN